MKNSTAIQKTEELLQQLLADDGSPSFKVALLRQVEEVRTTLQDPPDIANLYIKKAGNHFDTFSPFSCQAIPSSLFLIRVHTLLPKLGAV
jgi:hypothetical protein